MKSDVVAGLLDRCSRIVDLLEKERDSADEAAKAETIELLRWLRRPAVIAALRIRGYHKHGVL